MFSFVVEQDYFSTINKDDGDQRDITVLMYLTDVTEGGETIFPKGTWATEELRARYAVTEENGYVNSDGVRISPCASRDNEGIYVKPSAGDAVLFYGLTPDNVEDPHSLHASCPVISGTKWSATIWTHVNPFRLDAFAMDQTMYARKMRDEVQRIVDEKGLSLGSTGECKDHSELCRDWALAGDCAGAGADGEDALNVDEHMRSSVCCASCTIASRFGVSVADTRLRDALDGVARV